MLPELTLQILGTLVATLIGVIVAFKLDHRSQEQRKVSRVEQHLRALRREVERNRQIASENRSLMRAYQNGRNDEDIAHYVVEPYSTDAWKAALNEQILNYVDEELYELLQMVYGDIQTANEYVQRVRMEPLYEEFGRKQGNGVFRREAWTISVHHWDSAREKIGIYSIGALIENKSASISTNCMKALNFLSEPEMDDD